MTGDNEGRILALEELAAHQARTIEELSTEIARHWAVTEDLRRRLERLTDRFLELEETSREAPPVTKPPHY
jgi:SlyX protein